VARRDRDVKPTDDDAAVVDRLLRKLRASGPAPGPPGDALHASHRSRFEAASATSARPPAGRRPNAVPGPAGTWTRVGLGLFLGAALTQWPYDRGCGAGLVVYLLAVATLLTTAVWGAAASWKIHLAPAHAIALGTMLWALALAALEVLPRAGDPVTPAALWRCVAGQERLGDRPRGRRTARTAGATRTAAVSRSRPAAVGWRTNRVGSPPLRVSESRSCSSSSPPSTRPMIIGTTGKS